jgi:hypothetical protein
MNDKYNENDFDLEKNKTFENRFGHIRNFGQVFIFTMMIAGLSGAFGFSTWTKKTDTVSPETKVEYQCFLHARYETPLKVFFNGITEKDSTILIAIDAEYLKKVNIKTILPEPLEMYTRFETVYFRFKSADRKSGYITFNTFPVKGGTARLMLTVNDRPAIIKQFIYP